ncbi:nucleoporin complex subunit 54-domain-containing protein [Dichotomocladium elegans]|nr:nucleoporin complex subunit 54-domain-containing protein [Dichotomocladium elegans]
MQPALASNHSSRARLDRPALADSVQRIPIQRPGPPDLGASAIQPTIHFLHQRIQALGALAQQTTLQIREHPALTLVQMRPPTLPRLVSTLVGLTAMLQPQAIQVSDLEQQIISLESNSHRLDSLVTARNQNFCNISCYRPYHKQTGQQPQQPQQTPIGQTPPQNIWQKIALIRAHWDPSSHLCQFRHYFYNMVPASERHLYIKPPNQDEHLWNEAMQNNPDPANMVPVLATGFGDVLKRMEVQDQELMKHKEKIMEIAERVDIVQKKHSLGFQIKLEEHRRRHNELTQRLIRLLKYVQVLRYKGFPLDEDEQKLMESLKGMAQQQLNPEDLNTKLHYAWAALQEVRAKRQSRNGDNAESWRATSQEELAKIAKLIVQEQEGLRHVTSTLQKDLEDIEAIEEDLQSEVKRGGKMDLFMAS